jgi:hypothetical protein
MKKMKKMIKKTISDDHFYGNQIILTPYNEIAIYSHTLKMLLHDGITLKQYLKKVLQKEKIAIQFAYDRLKKGGNPYGRHQLTYKEAYVIDKKTRER